MNPETPAQNYQPESWSMLKDSIYNARESLSVGIEYAQELLSKHDTERGREHRSNRLSAEKMELDIDHMKKALAGLDKSNGCPYSGRTPFAPIGCAGWSNSNLNPET